MWTPVPGFEGGSSRGLGTRLGFVLSTGSGWSAGPEQMMHDIRRRFETVTAHQFRRDGIGDLVFRCCAPQAESPVLLLCTPYATASGYTM